MSIEINLKSFNFTDDELKELIKTQKEKLERCLKCYNECTEQTIKYIQQLENELKRRNSS